MRPEKSLIINLNLDWRVLVTLGVVVAVLSATYVVAAAQEGDVPDVNSAQVTEAVVSAIQLVEEPTWPDRPEGDFLPTTNYEWVPAAEVAAAPLSAAEVQAAATSGTIRHFYLTKVNYATDVASSACVSGYHMASLWEILDVSNLIYDHDHPQAYTKADSGQGPPSGWYGWVRTGFDSSGSSTTGTGNCLNWTSVSSTSHAVSVRLSRAWESAPGDISTWDATSFTCGITGPVWCVSN